MVSRWTSPRNDRLYSATQAPQTLPTILSPAEVATLLQAPSEPENPHDPHHPLCRRAARLRTLSAPRDRIDSGRMVLCIRQGKGQRDRCVMLSPRLLAAACGSTGNGAAAHFALPRPDPQPLARNTSLPAVPEGWRDGTVAQIRSIPTATPCVCQSFVGSWGRYAASPTPLGHQSLRTTSRYLHVTPQSPARRHSQSPRHLTPRPPPGRAAMTRPRLEVADIIQQYGAAYLARYGAVTSTAQRRVLQAVAQCRTASSAATKRQCDHCGHEEISYNSCRNRHCPKCQGPAQAAWLAARERELLAVPCCQWSLPCRHSSARSPCRIPRRSIPFCLAVPRRSRRLPVTPSI